MPNFEIIADDNNLCGEGPVWDVEKARLYWTDIVGLKFYCYEWKTHRHIPVHAGFEISSFALDESGGFVVANSAGYGYGTEWRILNLLWIELVMKTAG